MTSEQRLKAWLKTHFTETTLIRQFDDKDFDIRLYDVKWDWPHGRSRSTNIMVQVFPDGHGFSVYTDTPAKADVAADAVKGYWPNHQTN